MSCLIHFQGLVSSGLACQSDFPLRSRGNASNVQLELSNRQRPSLVGFWLGKQEAAYAAVVTPRKGTNQRFKALSFVSKMRLFLYNMFQYAIAILHMYPIINCPLLLPLLDSSSFDLCLARNALTTPAASRRPSMAQVSL